MITAITAIIAVLQTKKQIELSNKQHLFDLRIENYLVAKCLVEQYRNQKHLWEKEERNKQEITKYHKVWIMKKASL